VQKIIKKSLANLARFSNLLLTSNSLQYPLKYEYLKYVSLSRIGKTNSSKILNCIFLAVFNDFCTPVDRDFSDAFFQYVEKISILICVGLAVCNNKIFNAGACNIF
jgi:hypothetical protein